MTSLLALHCFTNYFGTCLGGVLLALLRLANFGTCVGCRRRLLALHCLANFGTCLGGVLLALLALLALLSLANFGTCLGGGLLA